MALDYEESKNKIVEKLQKKLKVKSKFYFNDLAKILEVKPREAKKVINYTDLQVPVSRPPPKTKNRRFYPARGRVYFFSDF
jgi:hypothetical protein